MEEAMHKFESMVVSAEQKLDDIEKEIDTEFSKHLDSEEEIDETEEDRASLLQTLEKVKSDYFSLSKEAAELNLAQRQMAEAFQQELLSQVKQLQMLQERGLSGADRRLEGDTEAAVNSLVRKSDGNESLSQIQNNPGMQ